VSSDYIILCLSHDPAIEVYGDDLPWSPSDALCAAANPDHPDHPEALTRHAACDLLVGRFSTPLIEVACPGGGERCHHGWTFGTWIEVGWLLLLHDAYNAGRDLAGYGLPSCWTPQRLARLAPLIHVTVHARTP